MDKMSKILKQLADIQIFIKKSLCISGAVEFVNLSDIFIDDKIVSGATFRCTDKKRGVFYISWHI